MSMISLAEMPAAVQTRSTDYSFKAIAIFCCAGLLASFCLLAASLTALGIHTPLVVALAILVAIISLLGGLIAIGGLIESLNPARIEAQERWMSEPYRFVDEGSGR